jgi:cytoplasmic FMR1 interacting protein
MHANAQAELNLSFDQLIFHLADDIFKYHKTVAASVLVDSNYMASLRELRPKAAKFVSTRYDGVMAQRTVNLLGRTVDIQQLLSEHVKPSHPRPSHPFPITPCLPPLYRPSHMYRPLIYR